MVNVTRHQLAKRDTFGIACKCRRTHPALKSRLLRCRRNCIEVIEQPDRVKPQRLCLLPNTGHRLICLNGVTNANKVHTPALWDEQAIFHCHEGKPLSYT